MENLADIASYIAAVTGVISVAIAIHHKWNERLTWEAEYSQGSNGLGANFCIAKGGIKKIFFSRGEVFESRYFKKIEPTKLVISNRDQSSEKFERWWGTPETSSNAKFLDSAIKNRATIWLKVYYQDPPGGLKTHEKWIRAKCKD